MGRSYALVLVLCLVLVSLPGFWAGTSSAAEEPVIIQGRATLEGANDHSGIDIEIKLVPRTNVAATTSTASDGSYQVHVPYWKGSGHYYAYAIWARKEGYRLTIVYILSSEVSPGITMMAPEIVLHSQKRLSFDWVYQADGTRNLTTGTLSSGSTTLYSSVEGSDDHCGFVFSSNTITDPVADVYFLDSQEHPYTFWANNGSGGVHDMGDVSLESVGEAPSGNAGYGQFYNSHGEDVVVGHTYVIKTMDGNHYAKIHVTEVGTGSPPEKPPRYDLTASVSPPKGGSIILDPPGGTYDEGTEVTVTANPAEGYEFDHWTGDYFGSSEKNGDEYSDSEGDVISSETYRNGVRLSLGNAEGWAVYEFSLSSPKDIKFNALIIEVYGKYTPLLPSIGAAAHFRVYNWTTEEYDKNTHMELPPEEGRTEIVLEQDPYVSDEGSVKVKVHALGFPTGDDYDIKSIRVSYISRQNPTTVKMDSDKSLTAHLKTEATAEIKDILLPSGAETGSSVPVKVKIKNKGNNAESFVVDVGLHSPREGLYFKPKETDEIPPGEIKLVTVSIEIPLDARKGPYDVDSLVYESWNYRNRLDRYFQKDAIKLKTPDIKVEINSPSELEELSGDVVIEADSTGAEKTKAVVPLLSEISSPETEQSIGDLYVAYAKNPNPNNEIFGKEYTIRGTVILSNKALAEAGKVVSSKSTGLLGKIMDVGTDIPFVNLLFEKVGDLYKEIFEESVIFIMNGDTKRDQSYFASNLTPTLIAARAKDGKWPSVGTTVRIRGTLKYKPTIAPRPDYVMEVSDITRLDSNDSLPDIIEKKIGEDVTYRGYIRRVEGDNLLLNDIGISSLSNVYRIWADVSDLPDEDVPVKGLIEIEGSLDKVKTSKTLCGLTWCDENDYYVKVTSLEAITAVKELNSINETKWRWDSTKTLDGFNLVRVIGWKSSEETRKTDMDEVLVKINNEGASEDVSKEIVDVNPRRAASSIEDATRGGEIIDKSVRGGISDVMVDIVIRMDHSKAASALAESAPSTASRITELVTEENVSIAAKIAEEGAKENLKRQASVIEEMETRSAAKLLTAIYDLPETPKIAATLLEAMNLDKSTSVIQIMIKKEEFDYIDGMFSRISDEKLNDIYSNLTKQQKEELLPHLSPSVKDRIALKKPLPLIMIASIIGAIVIVGGIFIYLRRR